MKTAASQILFGKQIVSKALLHCGSVTSLAKAFPCLQQSARRIPVVDSRQTEFGNE